MFLTRKDLAGTIVAALAVVIYAANVQDWWYLGSNRAAAVTMLVVGMIGCPVGARIVDERLTSPAIVGLGMLGVAALVVAFLAVVTAEQSALMALTVLTVLLWAGATLRHAVTPPPQMTVR
jgi:hypothetical protein